MLPRLRELASDVERLTSGLDDAALERRTVEGKWSLKELVCHLWRVQQVFAGRIDAMLAEDLPAVAVYGPDGDAEFDRMAAMAPAAVLSGFVEARRVLLERLERLSAEQWRRAGRHPEYPAYDVAFQVEYMVHHEGHHLYQMYQRRAEMGAVPHCG